MSSRTVSLFVPSLGGGGAERVMANLANGLADRGRQVDIVLLQEMGSYLGDLRPEVRRVDLRSKTVRGGILPLARYLRSEAPAILLSALDYANVGALLARRLARIDTRVVPTVHITHSEAAAHERTMQYAVVRATMKWTYPWADAIVAVSQGAAEDMIRNTGVPRALVRVIYNPVVTPRLVLLAREPLDHPWFAAGEPPVVIGIGRLTAQKDFPTLLGAVSRLREQKNVRLVILGEGEERSHLEEMIGQLGLTQDVALVGFVENPFAYLARASLFVLSSAWEALPTVLIEALALGVAVVSTDCPNGPMEILGGGRYGRLVPVGNVDAMADAIQSALTQPQPAIPPEALQPFTFDAAIEKYEKLIAELTGE